MSEPENAKINAAICIATMDRHDMLRDLLRSMTALEIPEDVEVFFVIIDNNEAGDSGPIVDELRSAFGDRKVYFDVEPIRGIPFSRNKAVEVALAKGADVVLFVDDDEIVPTDWFSKIWAFYKAEDHVLIGGPVKPRFDGEPADLMEKLVRDGLSARTARVAQKAADRVEKGEGHTVTVITSNWLADARIFKDHDIWFDTKLQFTGGSDTQFYRDVRAKGLSTGWCSDAYVIETIPEERLSLGYQFRRGKEQSRVSLAAKIRDKGLVKMVPVTFVSILLRSIGIAATTLLVFVKPGDALVRIARSSGWLVGRVTALLGAKSSLYAPDT
ncbi:glycosyltransferase [Litoreibacter roseus]|uniref:Glycosyltransferase 2-like domain-containing protein n=1 Tax=Litoreibacter roseus TaxID=2601869 RepID=A0A6N6JAE3_9RHOB|nr:glycosyltransferase [Litoreibacter roseus]GFE63213.1 hypothetical protein KIN_02870 [Litoreibacter roseus]